jgi:hypothetical protein
VSTVSIGSNRKYAENWDSIFKKGKATKKEAPATEKVKAQKQSAAKKKAKSDKGGRKAAKRKG